MRPLISAAAGHGLGVLSGVVARARQARPLHPVGAVLPGRLLRSGAGPHGASGVPWLDGWGADDVVVRLSRGGGLPAWCPDVHGLAVRHRTGDETGGRVVDVLLSTTGSAPVARHVLAPHVRVGRGTFTSLLPYRGPRGPVLLAARAVPRRALPSDPLALTALLAAAPLRLRLSWAQGLTGRWRPFGWLVVGGVPAYPPSATPDPPVRFDPVAAPPGLAAYPWVAALRDPAYAAARAAVPTPRDPALPAHVTGRTA